MKRSAGVVLALCLVSTAAMAAQPQLAWRDLDGDGATEAIVLYQERVPVKAYADRDRDGYPEMLIRYRNGVRETAEIDTDKDGRTDQWVYYDFKGISWKTARDQNRDGKPDFKEALFPHSWAEAVWR